MNPVENTIPEEELQKRTRFNNFTIMQYPLSNTKVAMLASHSTGCSAAGEGRGAERAGPAPAPHLQPQCSKSCMDRHAVTMPSQLHAS